MKLCSIQALVLLALMAGASASEMDSIIFADDTDVEEQDHFSPPRGREEYYTY